MFPNSQRINRGGHVIKDLVDASKAMRVKVEEREGEEPGKRPRVVGSLDGNRIYTEGHPGGTTAVRKGEVMTALKKEYDFSRGRRGAVLPPPTGKTRITIRIVLVASHGTSEPLLARE